MLLDRVSQLGAVLKSKHIESFGSKCTSSTSNWKSM